MKKQNAELKLLNALRGVIQWMSEVPENEKAESKAFKKAFRQLQRVYPTKIARRGNV